MLSDAERPTRVRAEQDQALRAYVRRQVYPYSVFNRNRLSAAGLGPMGIRVAADLDRIKPVAWTDVGDGADLVLRPQRNTITKLGSAGLAFRVLLGRVSGRRQNVDRTVIQPIYRPIHWLIQEGVPVGITANDLERLSELGRRWLETAGVRRSDVVASIIPGGPHLDFVQLTAATRRAGVAAVFLDPSPDLEDLALLRPTVLVGRPEDLRTLIERAVRLGSTALGEVHTVLSTGALLDDAVRHAILQRLGPGGAVMAAWAPPGVRALWAECRNGSSFHTWPAAEIVEVVDPATLEPLPEGGIGEIVWSALGWAGTVVLRLRTGVIGRLDETTCPTCGRTTPRVLPDSVARVAVPQTGPFAEVLDAHPGVAGWQAELSRRDGNVELVVYLNPSRPGHPGRLVRELDQRLQATMAPSQFVVLTAGELERRLATHGNQRVVDNGTP